MKEILDRYYPHWYTILSFLNIDEDLFLESLNSDEGKIEDKLNINSSKSSKLIKDIFIDKPKGYRVRKWLLLKDGKKACKNCNLVLSSEDFRVNSTNTDGLQTQCKKCQSTNTSKTQAFRQAKYRLAILNRIPSWANMLEIRDFYYDCPEGYHVDHIIPLQGKLVSGLHVLNNLQYLLALDNITKSNKFEPGSANHKNSS